MPIRIPLMETLIQYAKQNITSFHMPGHKGGRGFPREFLSNLGQMDVTEIPGMDNLYQPKGIILEAQQMAAKAFGAERSFFLVNGSTCGIHSMIMAACKPGDRLLIPRNSHKSVWPAMILADVRPIYIQPEYDSCNLMTTQISVEQVEKALDNNPDAAGLLLVHPNYYGMCSRIGQIEKLIHDRKKLLLVDEAHGAHFVFHPHLPLSSGEVGADMWVQSAHKTLPAFTQAAYLHTQGNRVDEKRVSQILSMVQTTSPSYLIMASLDWARGFMVGRGRELIDELLTQLQRIKKKLKNQLGLSTIDIYKRREEIGAIDPTRLVLDVRNLGLTGYEAERILREAGVQAEMSDICRVVFICSVADNEDAFNALFRACKELTARGGTQKFTYKPMSISREIPKQMMSPRKAFYSIIENIPLKESIGRICAGMIGAYPPGIPHFCPGELIDREGVEELLAIHRWGGNLFGMIDNTLVPVVKAG